jgi:hypothetical protein
MINKARMWVGITLLIVIGFNYSLIGFPLYKKAASIQDAAKTMLIKQAKSNDVLKGSREEYILDIFRKEKHGVDQGIMVLNCVSVSALLIVASWTVFGLLFKRKQ